MNKTTPLLWLRPVLRPVLRVGRRMRSAASVVAFHLQRALRRAFTLRDAPSAPIPDGSARQMPGSALYQHAAHPHIPRDVNALHHQRMARGGVNQRIALWLTKHVGSMACAYVFAAIGIGSLVGVFTDSVFLAALFGSISSYFLQLVLLPVISVGSNVLNQHQELQADEMFHTSQRSFHDIEGIMAHLSVQDAELVKQTRMLVALTTEGIGGSASTAPAHDASGGVTTTTLPPTTTARVATKKAKAIP